MVQMQAQTHRNGKHASFCQLHIEKTTKELILFHLRKKEASTKELMQAQIKCSSSNEVNAQI